MVPVALHGAPVKSAAMYDRPVVRLVDRDTQSPEPVSHRRNSIAFFDAQFANSGKRRFAIGAGRSNEQHRKFIDSQRYLAGSTSMPRSRAERTTMSATGSSPNSRTFSIVMSAPISISISITPVRVGLTPTLGIVTLASASNRGREYDKCRRRQVSGNLDISARQVLTAAQHYLGLALIHD